MWLDRLSGHSTPSRSPPPPGNNFVPLPRRPSHLAPSPAPQRPGFTPRSSSLSLVSNDSTTSLLASKRPSGSGLGQSAAVPGTPGIPDPLAVVERLLDNGSKKSSKPGKGANGVKPTRDDEEGELDFEGLSLREIVAEASSDIKDEHVYNTQTIDECLYSPARVLCAIADPELQMRETRTNSRISIDPSLPVMISLTLLRST